MKSFSMPLFWKYTIAVIVVAVLSAVVGSYWIWDYVAQALFRESEKRGLYIARDLSDISVNYLLYEDLITLQNLLNGALQNDSTVVYAFIQDADGNVVVHTFETAVPAGLIAANRGHAGEKSHVRLIDPVGTSNDPIRDIAAPVLDGKIGTVRVGIREASIHRQVRDIIRTLYLTVTVFIIAGIAGAFIFSYAISSPIKKIAAIADQLDFDESRFHAPKKIRIRQRFMGLFPMYFRVYDEIDLLTKRFNMMIQRLRAAYRQLEVARSTLIQSERLASIGTMAAGIAHEINNPLAGLQNCIRRILKNIENKEQLEKYIRLMDDAATKIEMIVSGLLDYSRNDASSFESVQMGDIIEKALVFARYKLEKTHISITTEVAEALPDISGNVNQMEPLFINLLMNSIDAIHQVCQLEPTHECSIQITAEQSQKKVVIHVSDTGIGIRKDRLNSIFDPFYTTKDVGEGTGLGLFVSYNIIKVHHGNMDVESTYRQGTTFSISLPIKEKV